MPPADQSPPPHRAPRTRLAEHRAIWQARLPGLSIAVLIALAASFLSEHYGAPAMLLTILIGLALHFLADDPRSAPGLEFAARTLLRFGIALLGLRISFAMFVDLGWPILLLLVAAVGLTVGFGILAARIGGRDAPFGVLTGGAVAICGASAAMAIAAVLPRRSAEQAERDMVFAVFGVTMLSTLAMILYPVLAAGLGLTDRATGVFLGATIHDVAQVVGAGFSVSDEAGAAAVLVKLIRVALLAPVVLVAALAFRRGLPNEDARPPLMPAFVVVFLVLVLANSALPLPGVVAEAAGSASRWALLTAIAAVGVRTSLKDVTTVGRTAVAILVAETLFLAALILAAMLLLPIGLS